MVSKKLILILAGSLSVLILVILVVVITRMTSPNLFDQNITTLEKTGPIEQSKDDTKFYPLPYDTKNPQVISVGLVYNFIGRITKIKKVGDDLQIITDINILKLPDFIVTKDTNVVLVGTVNKTATRQALKVGQKVRIFAYYGLKTHTWATNGVNIIPEGYNEATTSAQNR